MQLKSQFVFKFVLLIGCAILFSACAGMQRKEAVPVAVYPNIQIDSMTDIRYNPVKTDDLKAMVVEIAQKQKKVSLKTENKTVSYLSISGGGDNGAFGAGLLVGWTKHGDRPNFGLVTGISTGALIAPFAFLGSNYDYVLEDVYTNVKPSDIFIERNVLDGFFGDALADTTPLYRLISKHVNDNLLEKIAYEYEVNNRWLVIGTTNIDLGAPILWNMGKIASYKTKESLDLFRKILLASAAIPGAFPPVMIDVNATDGKSYQEMHVDGGATSQVFLYLPALANMANENHIKIAKQRQAYIIRNARLDPEWMNTERKTLPIISRAISQLLQAQGMGDLMRIYYVTQKDKIGFNLAYIPPSFNYDHKHEFDQEYMKALFAFSKNLAENGYKWDKYPPGLNETLEESVEKHAILENK